MKYRLGKKQKRAILEVETGKEFLIFPVGKEEDAQSYLNFLNNNETIKDSIIKIINIQIESLRKNLDYSLKKDNVRFRDFTYTINDINQLRKMKHLILCTPS